MGDTASTVQSPKNCARDEAYFLSNEKCEPSGKVASNQEVYRSSTDPLRRVVLTPRFCFSMFVEGSIHVTGSWTFSIGVRYYTPYFRCSVRKSECTLYVDIERLCHNNRQFEVIFANLRHCPFDSVSLQNTSTRPIIVVLWV